MSKETNLTSLKVYGNDDPAGSVYKVSGGAGGDYLALYVAEEETDNGANETIQYLTHKDGSIATWREIHDAMLQERRTFIVQLEGASPLQPKLMSLSPSSEAQESDDLYSIRHAEVVVYYNILGDQPSFVVALPNFPSGVGFTASTADERLEIHMAT